MMRLQRLLVLRAGWGFLDGQTVARFCCAAPGVTFAFLLHRRST
jgi:hypothetical protein